MSQTILVIGATGNTGKNVIRNLNYLINSKNENYRILGLTRSFNNTVSQDLVKLHHVEMQEKDWTTIDSNWLKEQGVVRVFIASHNMPHQFMDESTLHIALLDAGVEYVVRISTVAESVSPISPLYYARTHWAIENLLSQPEFAKLQWTSLQPNCFTETFLGPTASWIKQYQKTGKQEKLELLLDADANVGLVHPEDVGKVAANLLVLDDIKPHNQARYVLNGPEDVNGKKIVEAVEHFIGAKVQDVAFKDTRIMRELIKAAYSEKISDSIIGGLGGLWQGKFSSSKRPTSKEIMELAPPELNIVDTLKAMVEK